MKYNEKQWNRIMEHLEAIIYSMCAIYGLVLVITHFVFNGMLVPYFFDLLTIGLLFQLLGIYPLARRRSRKRLKKGKMLF